MVGKYFSLDEDFNNIIENSLKDKKINKVNFISTGWTNIVYEVNTNEGNYFFRFPRDDFWTRTIVKDCEFANYIYGKTKFDTVQLNQLDDKARPFSLHKKIEGVPLVEKIKDLTPAEIDQIAKEIADFMYQLHSVKFDKNEIFKTKDIGLNLVDFLDELIEKHLHEEDKVFWKYDEFSKKDNNCLVHGDLNSSNILIDENNHISAVIDFGFAGFGNKYYDISRILSRLSSDFKDEEMGNYFKNSIIKHYENASNNKLDYNVLDNEIALWKDIDGGYINYMRGIGIYE